MRAALYARVSSAIQRDRHTIESQLRVLPAFASSRGWEVVDTYIDDGRTAKSGHLEARGGLTRLLIDAAAKRFDVVIVIDLDRLTRSEDLVERGMILGALQRAGVRIACAGSGAVHDLNSSEGDLQVALGGYFAAEWLRKHRTRIVEGKLTAIGRGRKPAGRTPYGYRYDRETGVWSIDETEASIVREVFRRALAGETAAAIAEDFFVRGVSRPWGTWDRSTVYRMLAQPAYRGEWVADKQRRLTIAVPAIVSPADWFACRDRAASSGLRGLRRVSNTYLLAGLAVCALCGSRMLINSAGKKSMRRIPSPARYVCAKRRRPDRGEEPCPTRYWLTSEVDDRVWAAIAGFVNAPGRLERTAKKAFANAGSDRDTWKRDLDLAEQRLARLTRAEVAILERFQEGLISDDAFDLQLEKMKRSRAMAQLQVDAAAKAQITAGRAERRATALETMIRELRADAMEPTLAKRRELVERILKPGAVVISVATIEIDALFEEPIDVGHGDASNRRDATMTSLRIRLVA